MANPGGWVFPAEILYEPMSPEQIAEWDTRMAALNLGMMAYRTGDEEPLVIALGLWNNLAPEREKYRKLTPESARLWIEVEGLELE
ncbi:MAG: hypothetical protein Q7S31_01595 [bacterium]|nr:hypothetical protein [bacterium]